MKTLVMLVVLALVPLAARCSEAPIFTDDLNGKTAASRAVGVMFRQDGDRLSAFLSQPDATLEYPSGQFALRSGKIEFSFMFADGMPADHPMWCLFSDVGAASSYVGAINVHWRAGKHVLEYAIFDGATHHWCYSKTTDWQAGRWHRVGLAYGPSGMRLMVDGKIEDSNDYSGGLADTAKRIGFGDTFNQVPPVMVKEFHTYRACVDLLELSRPIICTSVSGPLSKCTVDYEIADDSAVRIDVVGTDGKVAKQLVGGDRKKTGAYSFTWDGGGVSDGLYTIRLTAESPSGKREKTDVVRVDSRLKWRKPEPAYDDLFPIASYYFCEDDASYINRHIDDPVKAKAYYDRTIKDIADHGVNMIVTAWTPKDHQQMVLDAAQRNGIKVIANLDDITSYITMGQVGGSRDPVEIASKAIAHLKDHPALGGYYIIDEPPSHPDLMKRMVASKTVLEALDPKHPSFSCLLGQYDKIMKEVDLQTLLIDVYPLYRDFQGDFSGYITSIERGMTAAKDKPLWVITQVFGKPEVWKIPSPEEIRAEVWLALACGARGIHYFIYQSTTDIQGERLQGLVDMKLNQVDTRLDEIARINADLKKLGPLLVNLRPADFTVPIASADILAKPFVDRSGAHYAIVANRSAANRASARWTGGAAQDVLTGAQVGAMITLEPGAGRVLRLE